MPGEQPKVADLVKLNTNENPYGPSPKALAAIAAEASDALRLYPDPNSDRLRQAIATYFDVPANTVFVGNGSDEVLAHAFLGLLKHDRPLLYPDITYSFYPVYCGLYEIEHDTVPLDHEFGIHIDDYLNRDCGAIILANPNAPTSCALPLAEIERLVAAKPDTVIVIDEAYIDFGGETAVPLTLRYPNLLVIPDHVKKPFAGWTAHWLRHRSSGTDRGTGARQELLQLLPARPHGHCRRRSSDGGCSVFSKTPANA